MTDYAIRIENLTKKYNLYAKPSDRLVEALLPFVKKRSGEHYALKGLDLQIKRGETLGLIGKNGSGKSTLLKIITGVLTPTSGSVTVEGRISALLELGAGFNMEYTGIENVYLNGIMLGFTKEEIDQRLSEILAFADIGDYVNQPVKTYSSGMFVRLAFALAINIEPEILIVDEALSVGDVFFQAKCYHKFEEFRAQGKTILFVSHDLSSIAKYADRVALLNEGELLETGDPKTVIDSYKQVLVGLTPVSVSGEGAKARKAACENAEAGKAPGDGAEAGNAPGDGAEARSAAVEGTEAGNAPGEGTEAQKAIREGTAAGNAPGEAAEALTAGRPERPEGAGKDLEERCPARTQESALLDYGDARARILEYYVTDAKGNRTGSIIKGERFTVHMKVEFLADLSAPIFAFTIKNVRGTEICGTNTMVEKAFLEPVKRGELKLISFEQPLDLQGGDYLISFGVTGFTGDTFEVYHRLYDALQLTCVSDKNTVGFYDMNSRVEVRDA